MATFLDSLTKLLKDKFQFKADILKNVKEIKIGCDESIHISGPILYICPEKLDNNTILELKNALLLALSPNSQEVYLDRDESRERLIELKAANKSDKFNIDFFEDKIQPTDFNILKIAVYCDYLFTNGEKTKAEQVKQEAILRYGELARNIINLYSTKYFETTIKPLYEILRDSGDTEFEDQFAEMYRIIVNEEIFTLFVSSGQTIEKTLQKLKEKILVNKQYGAYKINIHGINSENVSKIEKLIVEINDEIEGEPYIIKNGQAMMVKIFLKKQNNIPSGHRNDLVDIV